MHAGQKPFVSINSEFLNDRRSSSSIVCNRQNDGRNYSREQSHSSNSIEGVGTTPRMQTNSPSTLSSHMSPSPQMQSEARSYQLFQHHYVNSPFWQAHSPITSPQFLYASIQALPQDVVSSPLTRSMRSFSEQLHTGSNPIYDSIPKKPSYSNTNHRQQLQSYQLGSELVEEQKYYECKECAKHHCEQISMICVSCREQLCVCCLALHSGHGHAIEKGTAKCKEASQSLVASSLRALNGEIESLLARHDSLTSTRSDVIEMVQQHVHEAQRFARVIIEQVERNSEMLIGKVEEFAQDVNVRLDHAIARTRADLSELISSFRFIEDTKACFDDSDNRSHVIPFEAYLDLARNAKTIEESLAGKHSSRRRLSLEHGSLAEFKSGEKLELNENPILEAIRVEVDAAYRRIHRISLPVAGQDASIPSVVKRNRGGMESGSVGVEGGDGKCGVTRRSAEERGNGKTKREKKYPMQANLCLLDEYLQKKIGQASEQRAAAMTTTTVKKEKSELNSNRFRSPGDSRTENENQMCDDTTDFSQCEDYSHHFNSSNNNHSLQTNNNNNNNPIANASRRLFLTLKHTSLQDSQSFFSRNSIPLLPNNYNSSSSSTEKLSGYSSINRKGQSKSSGGAKSGNAGSPRAVAVAASAAMNSQQLNSKVDTIKSVDGYSSRSSSSSCSSNKQNSHRKSTGQNIHYARQRGRKSTSPQATAVHKDITPSTGIVRDPESLSSRLRKLLEQRRAASTRSTSSTLAVASSNRNIFTHRNHHSIVSHLLQGQQEVPLKAKSARPDQVVVAAPLATSKSFLNHNSLHGFLDFIHRKTMRKNDIFS